MCMFVRKNESRGREPKIIQRRKLTPLRSSQQSPPSTHNDGRVKDSDFAQGHGTIVQQKSNSFVVQFDVNELEQIIPKHWVKRLLRGRCTSASSDSEITLG